MMQRWNSAISVIVLAGAVGSSIAATTPAIAAQTSSPAGPDAAAKVARGKTLFISYGCGWCHEDGGRKAGKCPQLMGTERDDTFILSRIAAGSPEKMPAFGEALTAADLHALLMYIRGLKAGD
ncbi:MAG TPA: c-type cytochrome [Xanthobacteraceae bacterium]|jgi:mono/diheme cytochrome c family protein